VPDIDKLVTILNESQLADKVVPARKLGFPLDSDAMASCWVVDDFDYSVLPQDKWELEGANQTLPTPVVGGAIQVDDAGDGTRVRVTKNLNMVIRVPSPNESQVRFRSQLVIDNLNTHNLIGLFGALPSGNPLVNPLDGVYFRASNGGSGVVWTAVTRAFNIESTFNTSVIADLNKHNFEIVIAEGVVTFFIDGLLEATLSTNIPTADLFMGVVQIGRSAGAFGVQVDSALLWNKS